MVISMLKIRRPLGRLIFNIGIAIPGKTVFLIETAPRVTSCLYVYLRHHDHAYMNTPLSALRAGQNDPYFTENIFRYIFLMMVFDVWQISLKSVPEGFDGNISALLQVMAGRRLGE